VPQTRRTIEAHTSRFLHLLQSLSATTTASALSALACVVALGWALDSWHPDQILAWFGAISSAVTLVMVFVLQHTQTRQQAALQLKLDEILRALPRADERLIKLESASTEDLDEAERRHAAR